MPSNLPLAAGFRIARGTSAGLLPQMLASNQVAGKAVSQIADFVGGVKGRAAQLSAMGVVVEALVEYGMTNGPWRDRTGELRRAYVGEVINRGDAGVFGIFANTKEYAPYIEYTPGYWVLSGAMTAMEPMIKELLGDNLTIDKVQGS